MFYFACSEFLSADNTAVCACVVDSVLLRCVSFCFSRVRVFAFCLSPFVRVQFGLCVLLICVRAQFCFVFCSFEFCFVCECVCSLDLNVFFSACVFVRKFCFVCMCLCVICLVCVREFLFCVLFFCGVFRFVFHVCVQFCYMCAVYFLLYACAFLW